MSEKKEQAIIIAENPDYWTIHRKGRFLSKNMDKATAKVDYVVVYQSKIVKAITHVGHVTEIEDSVPYSEIYKDTQFKDKPGVARVYRVDKFEELEKPIYYDHARDKKAILSFEYCRIEDLQNANSLQDIRDARKKRT